MVKFTVKGDWKRTETFLDKVKNLIGRGRLDDYAKRGIKALQDATPVNTGVTRDSWDYKIERTTDGATISWFNTNENQGVNIALLIQYGHATGWGAYVKGVDYVNPAMQPIFDDIANEIWKELTIL